MRGAPIKVRNRRSVVMSKGQTGKLIGQLVQPMQILKLGNRQVARSSASSRCSISRHLLSAWSPISWRAEVLAAQHALVRRHKREHEGHWRQRHVAQDGHPQAGAGEGVEVRTLADEQQQADVHAAARMK